MNRIIFEVGRNTFDDAQSAIEMVEAKGSGTVIRCGVRENLPGRLPKEVVTSQAMWTYNLAGDRRWWSHSIHGGIGGRLAVEKPN